MEGGWLLDGSFLGALVPSFNYVRHVGGGDNDKVEDGKEKEGEEDAAAKAKKAEELEAAKQERLEKKRLRQAASRARNIVDMLENIKIFPVSGGVEGMYGRQKFQEKFDIAYVSQHGCHRVGDDQFPSLLKPSAKVVLETGKHVYALQAKQVRANTRLQAAPHAARGCILAHNLNPLIIRRSARSSRRRCSS